MHKNINTSTVNTQTLRMKGSDGVEATLLDGLCIGLLATTTLLSTDKRTILPSQARVGTPFKQLNTTTLAIINDLKGISTTLRGFNG